MLFLLSLIVDVWKIKKKQRPNTLNETDAMLQASVETVPISHNYRQAPLKRVITSVFILTNEKRFARLVPTCALLLPIFGADQAFSFW